MSNQLLKHFNQVIQVHEYEFRKILPFFDLYHLSKRENILEAGKKCHLNHFVSKGCLQMFFISEDGTERTIRFATENRWMTDYLAFQNGTITDFYIQAVEDTQVLSITYDNQEKLLNLFPKLEKYFRLIYQESYGKSLIMMKYLYDFSKEDIYFHFIEQSPELAKRLPQYLIASFLGFTPEYLSKIKKRS